jgi:hypothetical protein
MSKLALRLDELEISSFEPEKQDLKAVEDNTYDTVGVFCTYPKYSCYIACYPQ